MNTFGEWLKAELEGQEVKQTGLARDVNVNQGTVSRWTRGAEITPENVRAVARALRKNVDDLLMLAGYGPRAYDPAFPIVVREADDAATPLRRHDARRIRLVGAGSANPESGVPLLDEEPDGARFTLEVDGDCLAPEVGVGDLLLMHANKEIRVGDIVSVIVEGSRHIKRVAKKNGQMILESTHGRLVLPTDGAVIEGVMVGKYTKS